MAEFDRDSVLEFYVFDMTQLIEQLEVTIIKSETEYNIDQINEIFRIMHTIKGGSAMMRVDNITAVAHSVEDLFYYLREESPQGVNYKLLSDYALEGADFMRAELQKIEVGQPTDGDGTNIINNIKNFLADLKGETPTAKQEAVTNVTTATPAAMPDQAPTTTTAPQMGGTTMHRYNAKIYFQDGCEMENIRAYTLIHNMNDMASDFKHSPEDVINEEAIEFIRHNGFTLEFSSAHDYNKIHAHLSQTVYLQELVLEEVGSVTMDTAPMSATPVILASAEAEAPPEALETVQPAASSARQPAANASAPKVPAPAAAATTSGQSGVIQINVKKLDDLLNLMGELVISKAMVTDNDAVKSMEDSDEFNKNARQLGQIIERLQATVMEMRMVPIDQTLSKTIRQVRDLNNQLGKNARVDLIGKETEVDKNIIANLDKPIEHIIRNAMDHGVESPDERKRRGKPEQATIRIEAKSVGGDVLILISDDGGGIDTDRVLAKAREKGLTKKADHEYTDREIMQFIFHPGFSTAQSVTDISGRGVGMDVVVGDLEKVGGTALVDSEYGVGTTFTLKIPLTLAIIDGMRVKVADAHYTIPIQNIIKSFKATADQVFTDPNGNEMVTERKELYNVVRFHEFFNIKGAKENIEEGTLMILESGDYKICLLVDELEEQSAAVHKPMPKYFKKVQGIGGCTLLGNGEISLIVDVPALFDK